MVWRRGLKNRLPARSGSPLRAGLSRGRPFLGQGGLEFGAEVVLVPDEDLPGSVRVEGGVGVQDVEQDRLFVGLGAGQREADRQPMQGGQQVQAQSPEVTGVAAQWPYSAHPASSLRCASPRCLAHRHKPPTDDQPAP